MTTTAATTKQRDYALDLLRILSMIMIVTLHSGSHGGYMDSPDTIINIWQRLINALCLCSVNIFVLISGYFLVFERFRLSKLLKLCTEVWFYSIIIWLFTYYRGG